MQVRLEPTAPVRTTPVGERILVVAARLFYAQGITATGVDRIVADAGTTKRTLYQRFGSKDALVAAYLQQRAHRWQTELAQALADATVDDTAAAGLDVVYAHAARWAREGRRGCAFVNAWAEIGRTDHAAVAAIQAEKDWMRALFAQLAGGEAEQGRVLHLLYEGAQVDAAIHDDPTAFDAALRASRHLLPADCRLA